jgi:hypothetical protein
MKKIVPATDAVPRPKVVQLGRLPAALFFRAPLRGPLLVDDLKLLRTVQQRAGTALNRWTRAKAF